MYETKFYAYLLIIRSRLTNIIHQYGHQLGYSVNAGSICAVRGGAANGLALSLCLFKPFPGYRVYDVENAKFVGSRSLFEVGVDFLD